MTNYESLHIDGGGPLEGEFRVNSAKNSALYLILASLLTPEPVVLREIPRLSDVLVSLEILQHAGVEVAWQGRDLHMRADRITNCDAPYRLVSKMRASFVAMGALVARCGEARVSMPGGCAFGPRPVDRHIKAFQDLGVEILEQDGDFVARRHGSLAGRTTFETPTVGGTQNVLLASSIGNATVVIENAALEPEITDLAGMLNAMDARVEGAGTPTITVHGVEKLRGVIYRPIPDRIEAGTLMLAAAATRGRIVLQNIRVEHMTEVIALLREAGVGIDSIDGQAALVDARGPLRPVNVVADVYPQVPTDLQPPFGAFLATVNGVSTIQDRIYPDRFTHIEELASMGGSLELEDRTLIVRGKGLHGAVIHAADIRAGGALVVAALAAPGKSVVTGLEFIDRGYEALAARLRSLGASIERRGNDVALALSASD